MGLKVMLIRHAQSENNVQNNTARSKSSEGKSSNPISTVRLGFYTTRKTVFLAAGAISID
jgi:hypothetical protein